MTGGIGVLLGCISWSAFPKGFFSNQLEVLPFLTCRIHTDAYYMLLMLRSRNGSKNGQFSNVLVNDPVFLFSYHILLHYLINVRRDVLIVLLQAKLPDVQKLSLDVRRFSSVLT